MKFSSRLSVWWLAVAAVAVLTSACGQGNSTGNGTDSTSAGGTDTPAPVRKNVDLQGTDRYWNDLARWFAGMDPMPGSTTNSLDSLPESLRHRNFFNQAWDERENKWLGKLRTWARQEFPQAVDWRGNVFYPFAGADFMTISAIYPTGENYLMFGLEREGNLPTREVTAAYNRSKLPASFQRMEVALDDILNFTFFKTNDMQGDFIHTEFQGTTPILLAFMARSGYTILKLEPVIVQADGSLIVNPNPPTRFNDFQPFDTEVTGMRIWFTGQDTNFIQNLVYLQCDISNGGLDKTPQLGKYLEAYKPSVGFIKAASYLFHLGEFTRIRDYFMTNNELWVQDDTGPRYADIDQTKYDIRMYGHYIKPIALFSNRAQADLRAAFQDSARVRPLPFPIGYTYAPGTSNLLVVNQKGARAAGGNGTAPATRQDTSSTRRGNTRRGN